MMQVKPASGGRRRIVKDFFPDVERHTAIYKDLHENPELPCQEQRTATVVADRLETLGFEVERGIGGHGVVGILRNGSGQNVLLRSELDALPIKETTGLPYASKVEQVDADGIKKRCHARLRPRYAYDLLARGGSAAA